MTNSQRWRWIEEDPFGHLVYCGEDSWGHIADEHVAVVPFETGIRTTIADPVRVYFDPTSTTVTRQRGNPWAEVVHYVGGGYAHGRYVDHLIIVVVKLATRRALQTSLWAMWLQHTSPGGPCLD